MNPQPKKKVKLLKGKAYTEFRKKVAERAGEFCEECGVHAPRLFRGYFNLIWCGHVAHIKPRKKGGDTMDNVRWLCYHCHIEKEHGPRWTNKSLNT